MDIILKSANKNLLLMYSLIFVWLLATQRANALKCHVCRNLQDANCVNINTDNDERFLQNCPEDSTGCGLEVTNVPYLKVYRACASKSWTCKNGCYVCDSDGCNHGLEIKELPKNPGVEVTTTDLIQANLYSICGILLISGLVLIFCIIKCCTKNDFEEDYEEEEEEYEDEDNEYDFEYEETNEKSL